SVVEDLQRLDSAVHAAAERRPRVPVPSSDGARREASGNREDYSDVERATRTVVERFQGLDVHVGAARPFHTQAERGPRVAIPSRDVSDALPPGGREGPADEQR